MSHRHVLAVAILLCGISFVSGAQHRERTGRSGEVGVGPVPRLVNYGDVVRDGSGAPRRGTVGVTFAVYAERDGGSALWMETQNVELDEQGRYNVMLGAMTRDGLPSNLFGTGESRWLSVQVQLPGETEQARVLLVSVPYAMRAEDSASLGGRPATDYVLREHLTGWSGVLPVTPTTQEPPGGGGSKFVVTATGTVNFVPKATVVAGADVTYANSQIFDNGTNVGIGTTTPAGLLDISLTTNTNRNSLNTTVALNNSAPINGAVISALNMQLIDQSTASNLSKQSARMVYIRDAAATGGVLAFDTIFTTSAILNSNAPYQLRGANFEFPRVLAGRTLNNYIGLYLEGPPAGNGAVTSKFAMVTEPGAGNVGINTTNPLDALHVDGTVRVSGAGNGIRFPDGTLLTTATSGPGSGGGDITAVNAGTGLSGGGITGDVTLAANFTPAGGDAGAATTVARGDHLHDANYLKLTGGTLTGASSSPALEINQNGAGAGLRVLGNGLDPNVAITGNTTSTVAAAVGAFVGVKGLSQGSGSIGVHGESTGVGETYGVRGVIQGIGSTVAAGVKGEVTNLTASGSGIRGVTASTSLSSAGVSGEAMNTNSEAAGVRGVADGINSAGGIFGNVNFNGDLIRGIVGTTGGPSVAAFRVRGNGEVRGGSFHTLSGLRVDLRTDCALNEIMKWNGTSWTCAADISAAGTGGGTVTSVVAGLGLAGGTITTSGTLSLDFPIINPGTGSATQPARSDHTHDDRYLQIGGNSPLGAIGSIPSPMLTVHQGGGGPGAMISANGTGRALDVTSTFQDTARFRHFSSNLPFAAVRADVASPIAPAILGFATSTGTGEAKGVYGIASSTEGIGVDGQSFSTMSGSPIGVRGIVYGPTGTSGVFVTTDPLGKILSGRVGPSPATEVVAIDGAGNVSTSGNITASTGQVRVLGPGQGIVLKSPDGATCAQISLSNAGALVTTVIPCP